MPRHTEVLYVPHREAIATTNAWAFLHWLRFTHGIDLPDWAALQRLSTGDPSRFGGLIADFAQLPPKPLRLASSLPPELPPELSEPLNRLWPPALLLRPLADVLLHADLRPDDRVMIVGGHWPWLVSLLQGTTILLARPAALLDRAAEQRATVIIAPAATIAELRVPSVRHSSRSRFVTSPSSLPVARCHRSSAHVFIPGSNPT